MTRPVAELLNVDSDDRDEAWLEESLQSAVKLEFATIPLYLAAMWSIEDPPRGEFAGRCDSAFGVLRGIAVEEMLHLGLVCNILASLGKTPDIVGAVPSYPGYGLPGGVRPDLHVSLAGLTKDRIADLFMQIEYPEYTVPGTTPPPIPPAPDYATIGALYDAIADTVTRLGVTPTGANQLTDATFDNYGCIGVKAATPTTPAVPETLAAIGTNADILTAIETIKEQGEGTSKGPDAPDFEDELAHYFKFGSVLNGALYAQSADGSWGYTGTPVAFPAVAPMLEVPEGGYDDPPPNAVDALNAFNSAFSSVVDKLQLAWTANAPGHGDHALDDAIGGCSTSARWPRRSSRSPCRARRRSTVRRSSTPRRRRRSGSQAQLLARHRARVSHACDGRRRVELEPAGDAGVLARRQHRPLRGEERADGERDRRLADRLGGVQRRRRQVVELLPAARRPARSRRSRAPAHATAARPGRDPRRPRRPGRPADRPLAAFIAACARFATSGRIDAGPSPVISANVCSIGSRVAAARRPSARRGSRPGSSGCRAACTPTSRRSSAARRRRTGPPR